LADFYDAHNNFDRDHCFLYKKRRVKKIQFPYVSCSPQNSSILVRNIFASIIPSPIQLNIDCKNKQESAAKSRNFAGYSSE